MPVPVSRPTGQRGSGVPVVVGSWPNQYFFTNKFFPNNYSHTHRLAMSNTRNRGSTSTKDAKETKDSWICGLCRKEFKDDSSKIFECERC